MLPNSGLFGKGVFMLRVLTVLSCVLGFSIAVFADDIDLTSDNGFPAKYPTLTKLCEAQSLGRISLGNAVISPTEIIALDLQCSRTYSSHKISGVSVSIEHVIISGSSEFHESAQGSAVVQRDTVNGKSELYVVFSSPDLQVVTRSILRLNSGGQPIMMRDRYDGTVDPQDVAGPEHSSDYISGFYVNQSSMNASKSCAIAAWSADQMKACAQISADREMAVGVGAQYMFTPALALGWLDGKYPTDSDLDHAASRVDFQKAVQELSAALAESDPEISADTVSNLVKRADAALKSASSN